MKTLKVLRLGLIQFLFMGVAQADVAFESPSAKSSLSKSSVLKGVCEGSKDVKISGPGIDKNKKISCQKKRFWEYSLSNVYKNIPSGEIEIKVEQGSNSASRIFLNKVVEAPSPTPTPAPNPTPVPTPAPNPTPAPTPVPPTSNLDSKKAPAQNFDLSLWKLTLPVDSSGGVSGKAAEIKPIGATYQQKDSFYTAADGAMVFRAAAQGATTSGSKYPRSELREMTASYANAAWTIEDGGALSAELAVNELPVTSSGAKGRIVIGQIHGPDDELCRLYYDNGKLYYVNDKAGSSGNAETQYLLKSSAGAMTSIPLNSRFQYSIVVKDGIQTVSAIHEGVTFVASEKIGSFWPKKALYFKAGVYVQVGKPGSGAGTTGSGHAQVSFYKLSKPSH